MGRARLLFDIILLAVLLAPAALVLTAPALAQNLPPAQQGLAPAPANFYGLAPTEIICMATRADGSREEIASMKWEGGAVPAGACPPDATRLQSYTAESISTTDKSATKAGGND
jgi:hypothetical protein